MSNERRYSQEQIINLSKNFVYICDECMLSKSELTNKESDKFCFTENTYTRFRKYCVNGKDKYPDWCPRDDGIQNFVDVIRNNYLPTITKNDIMNKDLTDVKFTPKQNFEFLEWYSGIYNCYYLNSAGNFHYGILKIFKSDKTSDYKCETALGFCDLKIFQKFRKNLALDRLSLKSLCDEYNRDSKTCVYYPGSILLFHHSIMFILTAENNLFGRSIAIKRYDRGQSLTTHYQGGVGYMLSTMYDDRACTFHKIGLSAIQMDDKTEQMKALLELEMDCSNYIIKNDVTSQFNRKWFDLILDYE